MKKNFITERKVYFEPTKLCKVLSVKELYCIYSYWYSPTFYFAGESHEPLELVYVQTGSTVVTTNSYSTILNQGELIIHKPWDFHKIRANNTSCRVFIFSFSLTKNSTVKDITDRVYTTTDIDKYFITNILHIGSNLVAGKNDKPESNTPLEYGDSQIVKNSLELLLIHVANTKPNKDMTKPPELLTPTSPTVSKVITYLEENISSKITLDSLAKDMGYSVSRISDIFRREVGDSIIHYLNNMRIQKACEYISSGEKSIKTISELLAYDSVQYFSSQFKKAIGITPAQFRTQVKTDNTYLDIDFEKTGSFDTSEEE